MTGSRFVRMISVLLLIAGTADKALAVNLKNPALSPVKILEYQERNTQPLIMDGKCRFALYYDGGAPGAGNSIRPAVKFLQDVFEQCTGDRPRAFDLRQAAAEKKAGNLRIYVGGSRPVVALGTDVSRFPDQGFAVRGLPGAVVIAGRDNPNARKSPTDNRRGPENGTYYGALDFAERILGARFFFPGELGSYYPKITALSLPVFHYQDHPRFNVRGTTYFLWGAFSDEARVRYWQKYLGPVRKGDTSFASLLRIGGTAPRVGSHCPTPEKLLSSYPDKARTIFYTSTTGKLWHNPKQHIGNYYNVLDMAFADLLMDAWHAYFNSQGRDDRGFFSTWCGDYGLSFGVCDTNLPINEIIHHPTVKKYGLIRPEDIRRGEFASMANVYGRFYQYLGKRIQKDFPGRKLYILAYYNSTYAPTDPRWKLPENIEINLCDFRLPLKTRNPKAMEESRKLFREWYEALGNRPVQKTWLYNSRSTTFARAVAGEFVGDVPKVLGKYLGREEMFFDYDGTADMWHHYTSVYAACRSMWNPDWNVDAGIDEHWNLFYGMQAGPVLKEFHRQLKRIFIDYLAPSEEHSPVIPIAKINLLESLLKKADALLPSSGKERRRYNLYAAPWNKAFESQRIRQVYERPVARIYQLEPAEKILLDGKGSEPCWQKARKISLMDPRGSQSAPAYPADIRVIWSEKGLYGLLQTNYRPLAQPSNSLWKNCSYELFFSPGTKGEQVYQIAFDPLKQFYSSKHRLKPVPQPIDLAWKPAGMELQSIYHDSGWTAEFFIPFAAFEEKPPQVYDSWLFNLVRNKAVSPKEYSGTALTLGVNANLKMFGFITFAGIGER